MMENKLLVKESCKTAEISFLLQFGPPLIMNQLIAKYATAEILMKRLISNSSHHHVSKLSQCFQC